MAGETTTESSAGTRGGATSPLVFIFLTIFIDLLGIGILQPVLPFLVGQYRDDATVLGWLTASFALSQFLAAPVLGAISDRVGRRPVLMFSLLGTAAGYYLFGFATSLTMMFVARIVEGITGGSVSTAQAYIADVTPPEKRAKSFGLIGVAVGLGFIFGPAIGGFLAHWHLQAPVFFAGTLALLNALYGYFVLPESLQQKSREPLHIRNLNPLTRIARLFRDDRIRGLVLGFFAYNLAFAGFTSLFALFLKEKFNYGPAEAGGLLAAVGVVIAMVQGGLIGRLVQRFGEAKLVVAGLLIGATVFCIIPLVPKGAWLYVTQAGLAFGVALVTPTIRALLSNRVAQGEQGQVLGGTSGLLSLTQVLGPLWATALFDRVSHQLGAAPYIAGAPFYVSAALFMVAIVLVRSGLRTRTAAA